MAESFTESEIRDGKFFAAVSYLSFLCVVTLLLKKGNNFALAHAKQGLALFVLEVACFMLSIVPFLNAIMRYGGIIVLGGLSVLGILSVLRGRFIRLPLVSVLADKIIL